MTVLSLSCALWAGVAVAADPGNGASVYERHCSLCHGEDGVGMMPGVPDFTRGEGLMQPDRTLVDVIRQGKQVMPAFEGILSRDDIYDVVAFLRTMR